MTDILGQMLAELSVEQCSILGIGADAILGHSMQVKFPDHIGAIASLAARPAFWSEEEVADMTEQLGRIGPNLSGSHFLEVFGVAKLGELFWKWTHPTSENAVVKPDALDAPRLHRRTLDLLRTRLNIADLHRQAGSQVGDYQQEFRGVQHFVPGWQVGEKQLPDLLAVSHDHIVKLAGKQEDWAKTINSNI